LEGTESKLWDHQFARISRRSMQTMQSAFAVRSRALLPLLLLLLVVHNTRQD
jgi:uncharacterized integral membrane protein